MMLSDLRKLWQMYYIEDRLKECDRIERRVANSDYAESTKMKWGRDLKKWKNHYDETGHISMG